MSEPIRLPSLERGCRDKIKLGHTGYARNAERMAKKHGKRYAVYLCPHCGSTHLTTRLDGQYATKLLYVCKPINEKAVNNSDNSPGFDGVQYASVDRSSAMVFAKGIALNQKPVTSCMHWDVCPPLRKPELQEQDLTGRKAGRLVTVGKSRDIKARWVVKCSCGSYEVRSSKALKNPSNTKDKCVQCRRVAHAKRCHEYHTRGFNQKKLNAENKDSH